MCPHGYHHSGSMATPALGTRIHFDSVWHDRYFDILFVKTEIFVKFYPHRPSFYPYYLNNPT